MRSRGAVQRSQRSTQSFPKKPVRTALPDEGQDDESREVRRLAMCVNFGHLYHARSAHQGKSELFTAETVGSAGQGTELDKKLAAIRRFEPGAVPCDAARQQDHGTLQDGFDVLMGRIG